MKAVILAGGEGSRLRPVTCDRPKPMAEICGFPVLCYILELLRLHGFSEAILTLRYMPEIIKEYFPSGRYKDIKLGFSVEETPLKTAGSVRNALSDLDGDVLVISGDALCDTDLGAAIRLHRDTHADATIISARVSDPREYGLITCDGDRVTGFVEKPSFGGVTTDLANTGIYILSGKALGLIPAQKPFDFARDLFPLMLETGKRISVFRSDDYWCDIGDIRSYLKSQSDVLSHRVFTPLFGGASPGVVSESSLPKSARVFPPVYIGRSVHIGENAVIGPETVIGDGASVGSFSRIRSSAVLSMAYIGDNARLTGAVVCHSAVIKGSASLYEGCSVGAGAVIGENAEIMPSVSVWPYKTVEPGARVSDNLRYGNAKRELFDDSGISGETGTEITPEFCARVGAAAGTAVNPGRIGVACSSGNSESALKNAFVSGALSTGCDVWDFGVANEAQASFAAVECNIHALFYISGKTKTVIKCFSEGSLPLTRSLEREIQNRFTRGEFTRCGAQGFPAPADMSGITSLYRARLMEKAGGTLAGMRAQTVCSYEKNERELNGILLRLGCTADGICPAFHLSPDGTQLSVCTESGRFVPYEKLLVLCCGLELEAGRDVAVPYSAPRIIDRMARERGRSVLRILSCPADGYDEATRKEAARCRWLFDGMMITVYLLSALKRTGLSADELCDRFIPSFSTAKKNIPVKSAASAMNAFSGINDGDGVLVRDGESYILIHPSKKGNILELRAESETAETAVELCADYELRVRQKIKSEQQTEKSERQTSKIRSLQSSKSGRCNPQNDRALDFGEKKG